MKLEFVRDSSELILIYHPEMVDGKRILQELNNGKSWNIKRCFSVSIEQFRPNTDAEDFDESMAFCIGSVGKKYTKVAPNVLGTTNIFSY